MNDFSTLLSSVEDFDIELKNENEIEWELSQYSSLIFNIEENKYYAYTLDLNDEEEYFIPIDIDDENEIELYDYKITIFDKKDFKNLVEKTKDDFNEKTC